MAISVVCFSLPLCILLIPSVLLLNSDSLLLCLQSSHPPRFSVSVVIFHFLFLDFSHFLTYLIACVPLAFLSSLSSPLSVQSIVCQSNMW